MCGVPKLPVGQEMPNMEKLNTLESLITVNCCLLSLFLVDSGNANYISLAYESPSLAKKSQIEGLGMQRLLPKISFTFVKVTVFSLLLLKSASSNGA